MGDAVLTHPIVAADGGAQFLAPLVEEQPTQAIGKLWSSVPLLNRPDPLINLFYKSGDATMHNAW